MSKLNASLLDGSVAGTGEMHFTPGLPYAFRSECRDIELKRLGDALTNPGEKAVRLSGRGVLTSRLRGLIPADGAPAYHTLAGDGEFEIRRADFWEVPTMKSIAGAFSKEALTFGEAAGQFRIGGDKVHFDRVVASSPLLGVEGTGDVAFTGALEFKGIADPFGSWGDRVGDGGALSAIAGAVQRTVNIATSQVLYEIHVTGTTFSPRDYSSPGSAGDQQREGPVEPDARPESQRESPRRTPQAGRSPGERSSSSESLNDCHFRAARLRQQGQPQRGKRGHRAHRAKQETGKQLWIAFQIPL